MAGLKELRTRINSVKSTQKITSAMKMVAASRLRRSQILLNKCSAYFENLLIVANRLQNEIKDFEETSGSKLVVPELLKGTGKEETYLLVCISSDRGLCGGFNYSVAKETMLRIKQLKSEKKDVKLICIGRKARDILKRKHENMIVGFFGDVAKKGADYDESVALAKHIQIIMKEHEVDVCEIVYSRFVSAITRNITVEQIYPYKQEPTREEDVSLTKTMVKNSFFDYEPKLAEIYDEVIKLVLRAKLLQVFANSQASEHGARMTSMDSATRNAQEMLGKLTLRYNGIRQSAITTELTEIISGAEAI
ncbi:MAG: ATP synthase F1 subunit gamma [Alphaproteobacteria bacterium]